MFDYCYKNVVFPPVLATSLSVAALTESRQTLTLDVANCADE